MFLSRNVTAQPKWVVAELAVAQSAEKDIIPVELESMPELPSGVELAISGKQTIKLHQDFDEQFQALLSAIGGPPTSVAPRRALGQAKRMAARAGRVAKRHELGQKALMVGGALVAGGLAVARASASADAQRLTDEQAQAREAYGDQTSSLLAEGLAELMRTRDMLETSGQIDVMEFRREVKPRLMRIVGKLEGITPTLSDRNVLDDHHDLVQTFERLIDEFERVLESRDSGDAVGFEDAAQRANDKFVQSLEAALQWARAS